MKMKIWKYTGIFFIILAAMACEKEKDQPVYEIFGSWNWLKSYGGMTGRDLKTPGNTGTSKNFSFLRNDTVIITENAVTLQKTNFFLSREKSILLKDSFDFVTINYTYRISDTETLSLPMRYMIETLTDTLVLAEDVYDGYGHQFVRKR
jgi:hypothetical protein